MDGFENDGYRNDSSATYAFTGIAGSGTVSSGGANMVTETISSGGHSESLVFTAVTGSAGGLYQLAPPADGEGNGHGDDGGGSVDDAGGDNGAPATTYAFQYSTAGTTTTVTETVTHDQSVEQLTYVSANGAYTLSQDVVTYTGTGTSSGDGESASYSFSASGAITVTESSGGSSDSHVETVNPTATFTGLATNVGATQNTVTETYIEGNGVTTVTFTGSADAGYTIASTSTTYIAPAGTGPALDVNPEARAMFDFSAKTVSWVNDEGKLEDPHSLTADRHVTIADLGSVSGVAGVSGDFVGVTKLHDKHTSFDLYYSASGTGGEYMEIAHGSGSAGSVSLAGIAAQLASVNALHVLTT